VTTGATAAVSSEQSPFGQQETLAKFAQFSGNRKLKAAVGICSAAGSHTQHLVQFLRASQFDVQCLDAAERDLVLGRAGDCERPNGARSSARTAHALHCELGTTKIEISF